MSPNKQILLFIFGGLPIVCILLILFLVFNQSVNRIYLAVIVLIVFVIIALKYPFKGRKKEK